MLESLNIHTWEITILILSGLFLWGLLRERARKKKIRIQRQDTLKLSKKLLKLANRANSNHITDKSYVSHNAYPILPLSGDPADPDDRYVLAAMGMENNKQDFYKQAWLASHNNEYMSAKPGFW